MADANRTVEILLRAREMITGPVAKARTALRSLWDDTAGRVGGLIDRVMNLRNAIMGLAAYKAAQLILSPAVEDQQFTAKLARVLGSAERAKERFAELEGQSLAFGLDTGELVNANIMLEKFGAGALASGQRWQQMVDAAVGANEPIGAVTETYAKLWEAINNGGEIDRPVKQLQQMGLISSQTADRLKAMAAEGGSLNAFWTVATSGLDRYAGAAAAMGQTAAGAWARLKGQGEEVLGVIGEELLPVAQQELEGLIVDLQKLQQSGELRQFGKDAAEALHELVAAARAVSTWVSANREALKDMLQAGAAIFLMYKLTTTISMVRGALEGYKLAALGAAGASAAIGGGAGAEAAGAGLKALAQQVTGIGGLLKNLPLIAGTAFVGWQVGKALAELTELEKHVDKLQSKLINKPAIDAYLSASSVDEAQGPVKAARLRRRQEENRRRDAEARAAAAKQAEYDKAAPDRQLAAQDEEKQRKAAEAAAKKAAEERKNDAKAVAEALDDELKRREAVAKLQDELAEAREESFRRTIEEAFDTASSDLEDALNKAQVKLTIDDKAITEAEAALKKLHDRNRQSPEGRKAADRTARDTARDEQQLARRTADAEAVRERGGHVSRRGRELLAEADAKAELARRQAARQGTADQIAALEGQRKDLTAKRDTTQREQRLVDQDAKTAKLRTDLDAKLRAGSQGLAALTPEQLKQAREQAVQAAGEAPPDVQALAAKLGVDLGAGGPGAAAVAAAAAAKDPELAKTVAAGDQQIVAALGRVEKGIDKLAGW